MKKFISSSITYNTNNTEKNNIKTNNIFVLAGGQLKDGTVNAWVKERLDLVLNIKKTNKDASIYCIGGGTYHKSPIQNIYGHVIHESRSCSNYLISKGINYKNIKREWGSYDTIANGFFSFTNFILPLKLKECVIITSEFHMERAETIFNYFKNIFDSKVVITYLNSENNMDEELLKIRKQREKNSVDAFKEGVVGKLDTCNKFIEWFYSEHNAYNCINLESTDIDDSIKESY